VFSVRLPLWESSRRRPVSSAFQVADSRDHLSQCGHR